MAPPSSEPERAMMSFFIKAKDKLGEKARSIYVPAEFKVAVKRFLAYDMKCYGPFQPGDQALLPFGVAELFAKKGRIKLIEDRKERKPIIRDNKLKQEWINYLRSIGIRVRP